MMDFNNYEAFENVDIQNSTPELPTFSTPQTQRLRDKYPEIEQLESGDIGAWLQERKEQLWEQAKEIELGCNAAKTISLAVAGVGTICYATSPFAPIGAAIAGVAYAWTLFQDTNQTKKFAPVPFIKGNFLEFLNAMGDAGERDEYFSQQNADAETLLHLEATEQKEYLFLYEHLEQVTDFLESTQSGKRFYAYRWLLGVYKKHRALPTTQAFNQHLNQVAVSIDVDYERINRLQQLRVQAQLPQPTPAQISAAQENRQVDVFTGEYVATNKVETPFQQNTVLQNNVNSENRKGFGQVPTASKGFSQKSTPTQERSQRPVTTQVNPMGGNEIPNLSVQLADAMKLTLIVGTPGSGKGIFVSNALDAVRDSGKPVTIFYVDPKNDPKEDGYFEGRVDRLYRMDCMSADPEDVYDWLVGCLEDYEAFDCGTGTKLLVFDELKLAMSILGNVKKGVAWLTTKLSGYSSSGESRGIAFWGISQSAHTKAGFDGSDRAMFIPVFIIDGRNIAASEGLLASKMIPSDKRIGSEEIKRLCAKSPVGRAIFYGGDNKWYPMPKMENFSGFDRDSRAFINGDKPPQTQPKDLSQEELVQQLENSLKADSPVDTTQASANYTKVDLNDEHYFDAALDLIVQIVQNTPHERASFNAIRTSTKWKKSGIAKPGNPDLRKILGTAIEAEWIEGDEYIGYVYIGD